MGRTFASQTYECCQCNFNDTAYINEVCGNVAPFMTLLQTLIMARCDISDPCRRAGSDEVPLAESFDFIIVGAGIAGPILARRLSDNPRWKVLLVEAGPEEPSLTSLPGLPFHAENTTLDWKYFTEPTKPYPTACLESGGKCAWPRGKMVSGTGGMNGMMYVRGHPEIYNMWARSGNVGWSYNEIEHYFERAENVSHPQLLADEIIKKTQSEGPLNIEHFNSRPKFCHEILNAAKELGYKIGSLYGLKHTGFMIAPMTTRDGLRGTTSRVYLRPVAKRENLRVLTNAHVTKVLLVDEGTKVSGIELIDKEGNKRVLNAKKEIILTAGAIGSPHILLNSGIGPKKDLSKLGIKVNKDLPVGRNLCNHVSVGVVMSIRDNDFETLTLDAVNEFLMNRTGPLASTGITQVTAFLESSYATPGVPDIQVFFDGYSSFCPKTGYQRECSDGRMNICSMRRTIIARPTVVIPRSRGYLRLRSTDLLDYPLIYPNYFTDLTDMKILIQGIRKVLELARTRTMRMWDLRLEGKPHPWCSRYHLNSDAYWECIIRAKTGPENHQAGTCKMGPESDPEAVVNNELHVHGISNLRVADASIFPILTNANPVAPITMVAEKAADLIRARWFHI